VNQSYWPDPAATGQLLQDLAEDLAAAGHRVVVLTGRSAYSGGGSLPMRQEHRGVSVRRFAMTRFGRGSTTGRLADFLSFHLSVTWAMVRSGDVDVLFVESTPPLLVVAGLLAARLKGVPMVHVVQDLYPDVAEALGVLRRGSLLARALRRLNTWALRGATRIVVLGDDMAAALESYGIRDGKVTVIPNWADLAALAAPSEEVLALRQAWGVAGKRVAMYSGNFGLAHSFEEVLGAAERLRYRRDIAFLCVGDGAQWGALREAARDRGLDNIRFEPYQERARLGISLSVADVHIITQKPETLGLVVPSKVYGILAVGRPVVFAGPDRSEVARTIAACGAGQTVPPGDAVALSDGLLTYLDDSEKARRAGEAGRLWMEREGDRRHRTGAYRRLFEEVVEKGR
jgi:glycosyltransferase involved in cell wall biosynthesis